MTTLIKTFSLTQFGDSTSCTDHTEFDNQVNQWLMADPEIEIVGCKMTVALIDKKIYRTTILILYRKTNDAHETAAAPTPSPSQSGVTGPYLDTATLELPWMDAKRLAVDQFERNYSPRKTKPDICYNGFM